MSYHGMENLHKPYEQQQKSSLSWLAIPPSRPERQAVVPLPAPLPSLSGVWLRAQDQGRNNSVFL